MKIDRDQLANSESELFYEKGALLKRMKHWAKFFAYTVIVIATLVIIGWQFNLNFLKRPVPQLAAMNPATAISFIFCGFSFLLLSKTQAPQKVLWGTILACKIGRASCRKECRH